MADRGTLYDNMTREEFIREKSPDCAILNLGRSHYDSDSEYFEALISGIYQGPEVFNEPDGTKIRMYRRGNSVLVLDDEGTVTEYQIESLECMIGAVLNHREEGIEDGIEEVTEWKIEEVLEGNIKGLL